MAKTYNFQFDHEFYTRVRHNFKLYVLLISKGLHWNREAILSSIFRINGYRCHRSVKYGKYSSHIHVKFEEEHLAREAVEFLNKMNPDLTAILVDDMLRDWFTYELKSGFGPPCTLTVIDVIGNPPFSLNFLASNMLNAIFTDFGAPYLLPYTAAVSEIHVQVLFSSMTEALAAAMAFGEWYELGNKLDSFFYRVRINPSDKEALLITNSGGNPYDAFRLDYFVSFSRLNKMTQTKSSSQSKNYSNKCRKQKRSTVATSTTEPYTNFVNQIGHQTPILCVPVITPMNYNAEGMMVPNQQFGGTDFTNMVLSYQECYPNSVSATQATVSSHESNLEVSPVVQCPTSEGNLPECTDKVFQQILPAEQTNITACVPDVLPPPVLAKHHQSATKQKSNQKVHSRVSSKSLR